jgi:CcmD family protein
MKTFWILFNLLVLSITSVMAQASEEVAMADTFRQEGKIYVVVAVLVIILIGIFAYLMSIDAKMNKLEKEEE